MENPNYYVVIPAFVRTHPDLPMGAKMLYGDIVALCNQQGHCWASNAYFAKIHGTTPRTIVRWIVALIRAGFIDRDVKLDRENFRYLTIGQNCQGRQECHGGYDTNVMGWYDTGVINNNTKINNTMNSTDKPPTPFTPEFENFWKSWHPYDMVKGEKKQAYKSYQRVIKNGDTHEALIRRAAEYCSACRTSRTKTKHVATWLNNTSPDDSYASEPIFNNPGAELLYQSWKNSGNH